MIFEGGLHKQNILLDFIEDVGGVILQKSVIGLDLVVFFAISSEEIERVEEIASLLGGKVREAPLVGCEIALVSPSISRHHLPHPVCDISEYLRRYGAKVDVVGLAQGVGQRIARLNKDEKEIIEEHELAIFVLGNFEYCLLNKKYNLYKDLDIPVIVTGAPFLPSVPYAYAYVGGLGRIPRRLKSSETVARLEDVVKVASSCLENLRREISLDPLPVHPVLVKQEIERQMSDFFSDSSLSPVTLKVDGVRVELDYKKFVNKIGNIDIGNRKLREIAEIKASVMRRHILVKILPESVVGTVF